MMTVYIALLRGINVSGHNKIKMTELKTALETMGLGKVQTYIQSGNVLFESMETAALLRERIEREIKSVFGFSITVMLRTADELEQIIANCPFAADALSEGESIQVSVLNEALTQKQIDILSNNINKVDEYQIIGLIIYILYRQSILDSQLAKNLQKLGNAVTSRNWNTINKLDALAKAMGN